MNKAFWLVMVLVIVGSGIYYFQITPLTPINTFEDCVAAGNPVMESYPEQCRTKDGRVFVKSISTTPIPETPAPDVGRVRAPEDVTLSVGQMGSAAGLSLKVLAIKSDNRCPEDVQCIQAGKVVFTVQVGTSASNVHTFEYAGQAQVLEGYAISVTNITPNNNTKTGAIKTADYKITFHVAPTAQGQNL